MRHIGTSCRLAMAVLFVGPALPLASAEEGSFRGAHPENGAHGSDESLSARKLATNDEDIITVIGGTNGYPIFLKANQRGSLGKLDLVKLLAEPDADANNNNNNDVNDINMVIGDNGRFLSALGGTGRETLVKKSSHWDKHGQVHVRFLQKVEGLVVEGASLVVHADATDGMIESINGELVAVEQSKQDILANLLLLTHDNTIGGAMFQSSAFQQESNAQRLLDQAVVEAGVPQSGGKWMEHSKPQLAVVRRDIDGTACLAWKRLYQYYTKSNNGNSETLRHADMIFADATASISDGNDHRNIFYGTKPHPVLCASHPKIMGATGIPSMETYDCNESWGDNCILVSEHSGPISTNDRALNAAHNYALATYNYFFTNFGRRSMDDAGMTIISRVHYGVDYNNAFWDGTQMTYGDGDGVVFLPLSLALDVVAHELTHALTSSSSDLVYRGESGALNEALSDIFGALVEREEGGNETQIWLLGEAVYTPGIVGDALRNLADPASTGGFDFYPTRYKGDSDYGGVHSNSGIANLAFYLLVKGGSHPRQKTTVVVPPIGYVNAADIFYRANVDCLTSSSTFYMARVCTAEIFGGRYASAVHLAWDAVGVPRDPPPTIALASGVILRGQDAAFWEVLRYKLGPVNVGESVHCVTDADNGDADLFTRFGAPAQPVPSTEYNACYGYSYGSFEECTSGPAVVTTHLHVAVHAYNSFSNLSIICTISGRPMSVPSSAPSFFPTTSSISNDDPPYWKH